MWELTLAGNDPVPKSAEFTPTFSKHPTLTIFTTGTISLDRLQIAKSAEVIQEPLPPAIYNFSKDASSSRSPASWKIYETLAHTPLANSDVEILQKAR